MKQSALEFFFVMNMAKRSVHKEGAASGMFILERLISFVRKNISFVSALSIYNTLWPLNRVCYIEFNKQIKNAEKKCITKTTS